MSRKYERGGESPPAQFGSGVFVPQEHPRKAHSFNCGSEAAM
jgi:hypothetical protein